MKKIILIILILLFIGCARQFAVEHDRGIRNILYFGTELYKGRKYL